MNIVIRTDASSKIGSGHVMRCLSLSNALSKNGNDIRFICKEHTSNLINKIINIGYKVERLPVSKSKDSDVKSKHYEWLGGTQEDDAQKTINVIKSLAIDWMIVDHYALDERWHERVRHYVKQILVIDDLCDRKFNCDVLLNQNLGATKNNYHDLVPKSCKLLLGPKYALLRPEFAEWRDKSLERRKYLTKPKNILVAMGGVDAQNITTDIINKLAETSSLEGAVVNVVLGSQSQHIYTVKKAAKLSSHKVNIHLDTNRMAELMSQSDFAIGASGSSAWERCVLGVPSISYVVADNQINIANKLQKIGALVVIKSTDQLPAAIKVLESALRIFSQKSSEVLDGMGVLRIVNNLLPSTYLILAYDSKLVAKNLNKLSKQQLLEVLEARNHPSVRANMYTKHIISLDNHFAFIEKLSVDINSREFCVHQNESFVGVVSFRQIDWDNKKASFGIYSNLLRKVTMAGEKLMVVADFIIKQMGLCLITLQVDSKNYRAKSLYERWGYEIVGRTKVNGLLYIMYEKAYP